MQPVYWLFCTVIDNFGDIGVSWRLANELRHRLDAQVYLWLDDFQALKTLVPEANSAPSEYQGIHLRSWQEGINADLSNAPAPHVVIETFACKLPENVIERIQKHRPHWLNWEYLSAEDWAVHTHQMPSLQSNGLAKYFWQMGFSSQTGGLLRESNLVTQQLAFNREKQIAWRQQFNLPSFQENRLEWLLFGYQSDVWQKWLQTLQNMNVSITLWLAGGQIVQSLKKTGFLPQTFDEKNHSSYFSGSLQLISLPFLKQTEFDRLLSTVDYLVIRGEDSFVRAQFSGKPFLWHIYPQDEMAHLDKLDAFWQQFWQTNNEIADETKKAHYLLSNELNNAHTLTESQRQQAFNTLLQANNNWQKQSQNWQQFLFNQTDAITRLQQWLKTMTAKEK